VEILALRSERRPSISCRILTQGCLLMDRKTILSGSTALAGSMRLTLGGLMSSLVLVPIPHANALPVDGTVAAGSATIAATKGAVQINQTTQNAVINWQSFSIGQGEAVTFQQPNKTAVSLDRVIGGNPSSIAGSLSANGQVILVNPSGVLFTKGAQVNVGGLVASTLDVSNANVMAHTYKFAGSSTAGVVNKGSITANGGYVALLGANVDNQGVITAKLGTVVLAAGSAVTLDVAGNGLLNVAVDQGAVNALAKNGGLIKANGGQVVMTAQTASQLLKTVVNNTGIIEAQSIDAHNGTIRLLGGTAGGIVAVSGTLDASGSRPGQSGGNVVVTGNTVVLRGHAKINVAGAMGGGSVLIGTASPTAVPQATKVAMGKNVVITADSLATGNGGAVVLRSAGLTKVLGTITTRGGARSGNGGQVETSGQQVTTAATTTVNALAPHGTTGKWLLDPINYTIANAGGDETPASVEASLALANRTITATDNITVSDPITWSTPETLTLAAGNLVTVNGAMTASTAGAGIILTGGQGVVINAPLDADGIGNLIQLNATTGDLNINAAVTASASGAQVQLNAGHDVNVNAMTGLTPGGVVTASAGGSITFVADTLGVPGPTGGAVNICTTCAVTSTSVTVFYSPPNGYASPTPYTGFTAYEWVFVQANNKTYDGTTAATARFYGDPTVGGTIDVGLTGGTMSFADRNVGAAKPVTFSGYSINGSGAGAYALFSGAGITTANITPAPLTVTANSSAKTYGQTVTLAQTAFTANGLLGGDTIAGVTETSPGTPATAAVAGGPYTITPSNAVGGSYVATNYTTTYVPGALTVDPAPLIVTANNAAKTYGQLITLAPTAFTSAGLQNGDTIAGVTETSPGTAATAPVVGSPYTINASNAVGGTYVPSNYLTTYVPGDLTINPAALAITPDTAVKTYGQAITFDPAAFTSSGLQNGNTIAGVTEASSGAAATAPVAGNPYAITASNAVGEGFTPSNYLITFNAGVLTVIPASLTVTANSASKTVGQSTTFAPTAFTVAGLQNGDTIAGVTETSPGAAANATVAGGPYAITASNAVGGSFTPSNYNTTYNAGVLTTLPGAASPGGTTPGATSPGAASAGAAFPGAGSPGAASAGAISQGATSPGAASFGGAFDGAPFLGAARSVGTTPGVLTPGGTQSFDTIPAAATLAGTAILVDASVAALGAGGQPVIALVGSPLIVVGQGVRMPAFPAATQPAADVPAAAEYAPKPDRN
jgi:filamentous hemagglutinin family protein